MQANTIPATFWALAFLLLPDNQDHKQQILLALQSTSAHTDTGVPHAQAQQQTSPDGRLSAAVSSSEAVAAGKAAPAPGFDAATRKRALSDAETAISEAAAPMLDMQIAPSGARVQPYSKNCLSSLTQLTAPV